MIPTTRTRVFAYGTLRCGEPNHHLLDARMRLRVGRTEPHCTLVSLGAFPGMIDGGETAVGVEYPMPEHMNLKNVFSAAQGRRKRRGMSKALRLCGLGLEDAHHRALDDAKNIARLLPGIVGGRCLPTT